MKLFSRRQLCLTTALVAGLSLFGAACTKKKPADSGVSGAAGNKIFYHYRTSEMKTLDPMKQFDAASAQVVEMMYDGLFQYHYLKRPYVLEPALLESMPEKGADGAYVLKLRKGVKFHDNAAFPDGKGREMNADDVIFSLKRFANANVNDLSYSLIAGLVEGMDAYREESKKAGKAFDMSKVEISGLKKVDNYTLTLKFTSDSPLNFYPFAFSGMAIMPKEAVDKYGDDIDKNPVGTGAFMMKSYSRRGTTVLVKHPHYWEKFPTEGMPEDKDIIAQSGGKQLPFVDEVHMPLIEETQPQMLKFRKGNLHWVAISKDDFAGIVDHKPNTMEFTLKPDLQKQFELYYAPTLTTSYIKFGMRDSLVGKNKALRQAIALAMNSPGFIELMLNGRALVSDSIVPVEIAGAAKDTGSTWYRQDLEAAKKKLAEAGYPEGKGLPTLTIEYRSTTKDARQNFEYVRNELAKAGIKVTANFQTFSNFLQKTNNGNYQLADAGWNADYPDAENFYALLFSENKAPLPNDGNFENAQFDELYRKARVMANGPERIALFKQMDDIIKEEVPVIVLFDQLAMGMTQKSVVNFKRNMMDEYPYRYFDLKN